jgi:hypothetical protein
MDSMEESVLENPVVAQIVEELLACLGDIYEPAKFKALCNILQHAGPLGRRFLNSVGSYSRLLIQYI